MMLLATVVFSLYTIWVTPLVQRHGGPEVLSWATLLSAPAMLALNAPAALVAPYADFSAAAWTAFFWTVLVSAFFGWLLWIWVNASAASRTPRRCCTACRRWPASSPGSRSARASAA